MKPNEIGQRIRSLQQKIEMYQFEINELAKQYIPDFHWLDYKVSTFWKCDKSPIGMCLFKLDDYGRTVDCKYCGDPEERK